MGPTLGELSLEQAVAQLAKAHLAEARAAAKRLDDGGDHEALHDARVALRRLHSLLRTYQRELAAVVPAKRIKAVRQVARATNPARDAEVQHAWLKRLGKELDAAERPGLRWLIARYAPTEQATDIDGLRRGLARLGRKLRKPLAALARGGGAGYAPVAAAHGKTLAAEVLERLQTISGPDDKVAAHQARIAVKRLRYLLTPLRDAAPECALALDTLRELQDLLGDLHDRYVLQQTLPEHAAAAAAERGGELYERLAQHKRALPADAWRPPQLPGLLAVAQRNDVEIHRLYDLLQSRYLSRLEALRAHLQAVPRALAAPPRNDRVS